MIIKSVSWSINKLYHKKDKINDQPDYQRGEVWSNRKKALLIDSILRGIDLPKIYFRELVNNQYEYEVADGQQRIHAIIKFLNNDLKMPEYEDKGLNLSLIKGEKVGGLKYNELSKALKEKIDNYPLTISIVKDASKQEIRTLFGRLQEGISLVPAEKRNALVSNLHDPIDNFCLNHKFFNNSRISSLRYKHQDYLAHVIALMKYANKRDLKADLLMDLYLDKNINITNHDNLVLSTILDLMFEIDSYSKVRIYKKYNFIDVFMYLYNSFKKIDLLNPKEFAELYDKLEGLRLEYNNEPDLLLSSEEVEDSDRFLYNYCIAFRHEGARTKSIDERQKFYNYNYNQLLRNEF